MNILICSDYVSSWNMGGATRVLLHQLQSLASSEHQATLLSGCPADEHGELPVPWIRHRYKSFSFVPQLLKSLLKLKREFQPDLLHLHQPFVALLAHFIMPSATVRLYHFHSYWGEEKLSHAQNLISKVWSMGKGALERWILKRMDAFIVLSEYSKQRLLESVPQAKIHVVPGAADVKAWSSQSTSRSQTQLKLLSVRRLDPRMGLDLLLKALAEFIEENLHLNLKLNIVGTGRDEQRLKDLAVQLNLQNHVQFCGRVDEEELQKLMLSHHGMIIPTREMEGFGMSVIESWAAGLPVMATNAGALGEFARHGEVIHLIGEPTVENIKSGLTWCREHWMDSRDLDMKRLSQQCRDVASLTYSHQVITQQLLNLYGTYRR